MTIFHIAETSFWDAAQLRGSYRVPSLDAEGFIHLSTRTQFIGTARRYYRGRTDLVLLEVDEDRLPDSALRHEPSTNAELFPHLYAELPTSAVVRVHTFAPDADGEFSMPSSID